MNEATMEESPTLDMLKRNLGRILKREILRKRVLTILQEAEIKARFNKEAAKTFIEKIRGLIKPTLPGGAIDDLQSFVGKLEICNSDVAKKFFVSPQTLLQ